jgi:hypothetical protein
MDAHPSARVLLTSAAIFALSTGCIPTNPYQTTFNVPMLFPRDKSDRIKQGVQVSVVPVTRENQGNFPQIARLVKWREPDRSAWEVPGVESRPHTSEAVERSGLVELAPLPAFFVVISNNTGSLLSLSGMKIEVEDSSHRPYSVVLNAEALRKRFFEDVTGANPFLAGDRALMDDLMRQISNLPILNPDVAVRDQDVWRGFLALDINARTPREYYSLMKSIQGFTVRLKDVPTSAGPSDFYFELDKAERAITLNCAGGVRDPSPEKCAVARVKFYNTPLGGESSPRSAH